VEGPARNVGSPLSCRYPGYDHDPRLSRVVVSPAHQEKR
jgi:hypothetical protein